MISGLASVTLYGGKVKAHGKFTTSATRDFPVQEIGSSGVQESSASTTTNLNPRISI